VTYEGLDAVTLAKRAAAEYAVDHAVESGMRIGLGTGSTAIWAVRRVGELLAEGTLADVVAVPTSNATEADARTCGVPLTTLEDNPVLDVTVDGADEVDPALDCIKGGGGAHLREKLVAQASRRLVIVVDSSKLVPALGTAFPVPVEIVQMGRVPETLYVESLGYDVSWRHRDGRPFVTDEGNWILDVTTGPIQDKQGLLDRLLRRAGVIEVGLFLGMASDVVVARIAGDVPHSVEHLTR
jgi:ribose 5-phosphate isomerase A